MPLSDYELERLRELERKVEELQSFRDEVIAILTSPWAHTAIKEDALKVFKGIDRSGA